MTSERIVRKSLAGVQDLLLGKGKVSQTRGDNVLEIDRLDVYLAIDTLNELRALDVTDFTRARVYSSTSVFIEFIYDVDATEGESPDDPTDTGHWVVVDDRVSTTVLLDDVGSRENVIGKYIGKTLFNSTSNRPVWASGVSPTDLWVFSDGTTAHTPI